VAKARDDPPLLEWIAGAIGALAFAAMLVVLVSTGVRGGQAPPDIVATIGDIRTVEGGYVAEFTARNRGDVTAADVEVVATLANGTERRASFDYLSPHSERHGGFFFEDDPLGMQLHAEGYRDP